MELQWVVRTQTDIKPDFEEIGEWIPLVRQEKRIVAERTHGKTDLLQIEEILQRRNLAQQNPMGDGMGCQKTGRKMIRVSGFSAMRAEHESIYAPSIKLPSPFYRNSHTH